MTLQTVPCDLVYRGLTWKTMCLCLSVVISEVHMSLPREVISEVRSAEPDLEELSGREQKSFFNKISGGN